MKKEKIIPQIIGILVNEGINALEAKSILEEAQRVFLERSYHIQKKKKQTD